MQRQAKPRFAELTRGKVKSFEDAGRPAFGAILRRLRLMAGLSQEVLAERARISIATVSALERGTRQVPHRDTLQLLTQALQLSGADREELMAATARPKRVRFMQRPTAARSSQPLTAFSENDAATALYGIQLPQHNLPTQLSSFVGADDVVAQVTVLVTAHRLITLAGTGGIGKTRVALQVAENLTASWTDAIKFVDLSPVGDGKLVAGTIAAALGVQESLKQQLLQTIVDSLKTRRLLLIVDNCEHVIEEVRRAVFTILNACRGVHVLATSQQPLKIAGERIYRVPSLAYPLHPIEDATVAARYPAVALFVDRAKASDNEFHFSNTSAMHVTEICRRLDGIPLAIELAAARVKVLGAQQLSRRLDNRFQILIGDDCTAPSRHQTMEATLSWSYELLSASEQRMFERLSVFAGACTLEMANAVCAGEGIEEAGVLQLVSSLVDKSLVIAEEVRDEKRYGLLESSRQYGRAKLTRRGETETFVGRHAVKYLELARRFESLRISVNRCGDLRRVDALIDAVEREQPNFNAAVVWSLGARGDIALGQRLISAKIWDSHIAEPLRWVQVALDVCDADTAPATIALLERRFAEHLEQRHEFDRALAARRRESAILCELHDPGEIVANQVNMAMNLLRMGRIDEAEVAAELADASARALSNRRLLGLAKDTLGTVRLARGDYRGGRPLSAEAVQLLRAEGDELRVAVCEVNLAAHEFGLGNASAALEHSERALPVLRAWRHADLAESLSNEATFLIALSCYDEAQRRAIESLTVSLKTIVDAPAGALHAMQRLAAIAALRPHADPADARKGRMLAAQLFGYAEARLTGQGAFRWPTDQRDVDRAMTSLTRTLKRNEITQLMQRGAAMSYNEAIAHTLPLTVAGRVDS